MPVRLPSLIVAGTLLVIPWVLFTSLIDPARLPRTVVWSAMLALSALLVLHRGSRFREAYGLLLSRPAFPVLLLVYFGTVVLSVTQAGEPFEAVFETLQTGLWVASVWLLALILKRDREAFGLFCRVAVVVMFGLAAVGLLQRYELAFLDLPGSRPPQATMVNRNLLSSILCLLGPFALYTSLRRGAVWRALAVLALAAAAALIMLANTRAAWAALGTAGAITGVILVWLYSGLRLRRRQKQLYRRRLGLTVAIVAVVAVFFGSPLPRGDQQSMIGRVADATALGRASVGERLGLWKRTLPLIWDSPVLGVGPGNWKVEHAREGLEGLLSEGGRTLYQRPHNDFLWVASESGLAAALAYLGLLVYALYTCVVCLRRSGNKDTILIAAVMLFGLIVWAVIATFSYPKERVAHLLLTALMLASVWAVAAEETLPQKPTRRIALTVPLIAVLVVAIAGGIVSSERMRSEQHTRRAIEARRRGDWHGVIREMHRAQSWAVKMDPTATPLSWYRGVGYFSLGRIDAAMKDFRAACAVNPYHLYSLNNLAACYERRGQHDRAERHYLESLRLSPHSTEALINLAAVYFNVGRYRDAARLMEQLPDTTSDPRVETYRARIESKLNKAASP